MKLTLLLQSLLPGNGNTLLLSKVGLDGRWEL